MRTVEPVPAGTALWDIATPSRLRLAGVSMAGFRNRATELVDLQVVPYPAVTMIMDLAGGVEANDVRGNVVAGMDPGMIRGRGHGIECLQVRLSPVVAHAVLGPLDGTIGTLEGLWGSAAVRLQERLRDLGTWEERFALVEAALAGRCDVGHAVDPEIAYAWNRMVTGRGQVRIDSLAAEVGWSRRRMWQRFRAQVGIGPKRAAQLVRFDHAAHRLAAGHSAAAVAAESGYVDQSHLNREAMSFAGITPTAVAAAPWLAVDDVAWA